MNTPFHSKLRAAMVTLSTAPNFTLTLHIVLPAPLHILDVLNVTKEFQHRLVLIKMKFCQPISIKYGVY